MPPPPPSHKYLWFNLWNRWGQVFKLWHIRFFENIPNLLDPCNWKKTVILDSGPHWIWVMFNTTYCRILSYSVEWLSYGLGDQELGARFPKITEGFSPPHSIQTDCEEHAFYPPHTRSFSFSTEARAWSWTSVNIHFRGKACKKLCLRFP